MDADAPSRVALGIARLRLLANPGSCPEIVVVARRQRDVDGVGDLAVAVGPERRAVDGLAGLPGQSAGVVRRPYELLDLDDDVISRAKAGGSLHSLSYRQEPRHDGGPPSGFGRSTRLPELSASRELVAKVSLTADFVSQAALQRKCRTPRGRSIQRTRAAVLRLSPLGARSRSVHPDERKESPSAPPCRPLKSRPCSKAPKTSSRRPKSARSRRTRCPLPRIRCSFSSTRSVATRC